MAKKLYLTEDYFLMKLEDGWIEFVSNVSDFSEPVHPEDLYYISRGFGVPLEVLEDFYYN